MEKFNAWRSACDKKIKIKIKSCHPTGARSWLWLRVFGFSLIKYLSYEPSRKPNVIRLYLGETVIVYWQVNKSINCLEIQFLIKLFFFHIREEIYICRYYMCQIQLPRKQEYHSTVIHPQLLSWATPQCFQWYNKILGAGIKRNCFPSRRKEEFNAWNVLANLNRLINIIPLFLVGVASRLRRDDWLAFISRSARDEYY